MKRKIVGIFVIALLTISYMPIVSSEISQVPESNETQDDDIKFFFTGWTVSYGDGLGNTFVKLFIARFGVYLDIKSFEIDVIAKSYLKVDGKIEQLEPYHTLILHNFSGIGTPYGFMEFLSGAIVAMRVCFTGSCESYEIKNWNNMATYLHKEY